MWTLVAPLVDIGGHTGVDIRGSTDVHVGGLGRQRPFELITQGAAGDLEAVRHLLQRHASRLQLAHQLQIDGWGLAVRHREVLRCGFVWTPPTCTVVAGVRHAWPSRQALIPRSITRPSMDECLYNTDEPSQFLCTHLRDEPVDGAPQLFGRFRVRRPLEKFVEIHL
jgi:hypothetical protein